jgi:hypothetical protein
MSDFDPSYVFSHHAASPEQLAQFASIHEGAKQFAEVLLRTVPDCTDRDQVLQLLRETAMLACSAVSLSGRLK